MLLAAVQCCMIYRNFGVLSKLVLALLHFVQDFCIGRFYYPALLHFWQDFSKYVTGC